MAQVLTRNPVTMRHRMLALVRGDEVDRVPFVQYDGLAAANTEIWDLVGRDRMGVLRWTMPYRREHPNCRSRSADIERDGLRGQRTHMETPAGTLVEERFQEPTYGSSWIDKHYVSSIDDYEALTAWFEDEVIVADPEVLARARQDLGEDGLPLVRVERTPYQQLWIQWVGVDDLVLHMADEPDRVQRCIDAIARRQRDVFHAVADMDIDFVDFPDNITAPVIGERYFRQYCVPAYDELADVVGDAVPVYVHMDGDLRPLMDAIGESRVVGIDSLSPPPDNDTSPADVLGRWPHMRVAINFPSSVHLAPPEEVYAVTADFLQQAGNSGRFQIQLSENVPPFAWRTSLPEIVRAIDDFHAAA